MSLQSFDQSISINLKVTTLLDQVITGSIYTYSSSNEILVLRINRNDQKDQKDQKDQNQEDSNKIHTYRIINTSFIKSIQVLPPFPNKINNNKKSNQKHEKDKVNLQPINIDDLKQILKHQIKNYKPTSTHQENSSPSSVQQKSSQSISSPQKHPQHNDNTTTTATTDPSKTNTQHNITTTTNTKTAKSSSPHPQSNNQTIALKLNKKFKEKFGDKNVKINPKQTEITIFKDIKITKPFTNTSKNILILNKSSKHLIPFQKILKQFWLDIDNEKKGG
ncbi:hypothetical protein KGF54_005162 [Candida jiufengensis]|uniref:uncharacterized protein n=1 Tax=Candida jiufengensis TaxID=497108 RepID=UPI002225428A|nr:uncharacterized protein KGF54_005162 [Candida jiufengensis]KAI5950345.1 hypothetical protein KGF54_005162 [Candida jiufengensis]